MGRVIPLGSNLLSLLLGWCRRGLPLLIIAAVFIAQRAYFIGVGEDRADARHAAVAAQRAQAQRLEAARVRNAEADHARRLNDIDRAHLEDLQHAKAALDTAVADLDAGRLRLRRAAHDQCADRQLSAPATTTAISDGAEASGLSRANAEFLLRVGADADDTARQLATCQAVVASYYAACGVAPSVPVER